MCSFGLLTCWYHFKLAGTAHCCCGKCSDVFICVSDILVSLQVSRHCPLLLSEMFWCVHLCDILVSLQVGRHGTLLLWEMFWCVRLGKWHFGITSISRHCTLLLWEMLWCVHFCKWHIGITSSHVYEFKKVSLLPRFRHPQYNGTECCEQKVAICRVLTVL